MRKNVKRGCLQRMAIVITAAVFLHVAGCSSSDYVIGKLYVQQEDWEHAKPYLLKETSKNPANAEAWYLLGLVSERLGQSDSAAESFHEAVRLDSTFRDRVAEEFGEMSPTDAPGDMREFRTKFESAIESGNYLSADAIKMDWLDTLEARTSTSLTRRDRATLDCLQSLVGLTDSTLLEIRRTIYVRLKTDKYEEARALRDTLRRRVQSVYGLTNSDLQLDYIFQHRLSDSERSDLRFINILIPQ